MEKAQFERKFNVARDSNFVVVELRNATFYADNYRFVDDSGYVDLFWKDAEVGYCKLSSIKEVR